jgi:hypothetical protein
MDFQKKRVQLLAFIVGIIALSITGIFFILFLCYSLWAFRFDSVLGAKFESFLGQEDWFLVVIEFLDCRLVNL